MLSAMVVENRTGSWATMPIFSLSQLGLMPLMSTSRRRIEPEFGEYKLCNSEAIVDLPEERQHGECMAVAECGSCSCRLWQLQLQNVAVAFAECGSWKSY